MSDEPMPEMPEPYLDYEGELWPTLEKLDPTIHPEMLAEQRLIRLEALVARLIELVPIDTDLSGVYEPILSFRPEGFTTRDEFAKQQQRIINHRALKAMREAT